MNNPLFPSTNQRARLKWLPDDPGVIVAAGPEQSAIRHDSDKRERIYPNEQFEPAPPKIKAQNNKEAKDE